MWLVVLGSGDWLAARGVRFAPGKYEVSDELAEQARSSGIKRLMVLEHEPEIVQDEPGSILTREDVRRGGAYGVRIVEAERIAGEPVEVSDGPEAEYHCLYCTISRRSQAALDRHVEFRHKET